MVTVWTALSAPEQLTKILEKYKDASAIDRAAVTALLEQSAQHDPTKVGYSSGDINSELFGKVNAMLEMQSEIAENVLRIREDIKGAHFRAHT
jgi:hypothetical protein